MREGTPIPGKRTTTAGGVTIQEPEGGGTVDPDAQIKHSK